MRHNPIAFALAATLLASIPIQASGSWANSVHDYSPGEREVIGGSEFSDPNLALGPVDPDASMTSQSLQVVQLGQRGSITLGFVGPVQNNAADAGNADNPQGFDFTVYGNAFQISGAGLYFREPGFVEVAQKQANGSPGEFYLLLPAKLPNNLVAPTPFVPGDTGPGAELLAGYADVHPVNGLGDPDLSPEITGSAGGDGFKLEWAVLQLEPGVPLLDVNEQVQYVPLASIDFIRITDALPTDRTQTGKITTDIDAVYDLPGTPIPEPMMMSSPMIAGWMMLRRRRR